MKNFRQRILAVFAGILIGTAGIALAATFTKFSPATGILKGSASTYVTTAASSSDLLTVIGTVPVANGGTNLTTASDDNTIVGNGTTWQSKALPNCGSSTQALAYSTSTNAFSCQTITGSAAGADTQVQFNSSNALAGDADFTWASSTNILTIGSAATPGNIVAPSNAGTGVTLSVTGGASSGAGNASGQLVLSSGTPADGNSGNLTIQTPGAVGTNRNGGNVLIKTGAATGVGTNGQISLQSPAGSERWKINASGDVTLLSSFVDQSMVEIIPTTGFTQTVNANQGGFFINPAGTLATGTINLPASPNGGRRVCFTTSQTITTLTVSGNGSTIVTGAAPTTITVSTPFCMMFDANTPGWYRSL